MNVKRLLAKLRQHKILVLSLLGIMALIASAPFIYRAFQLVGLPDIGPPFDMEKYGIIEITDDENAFVEYNQAVPTEDPYGVTDVIENGWSTATPAIRKWLDDNSDAQELMKSGANKPKALITQPKDQSWGLLLDVGKHNDLSRLAQLRAARLIDAGHVEEAWIWYRVAYRHSRHVGMYGGSLDRWMGSLYFLLLCPRIIAWSADSRTSETLLRQALDDVISDYKLTQPLSTTLRCQYFQHVNLLSKHDIEEYSDFLDASPRVLYLKNEPELGKRVINLAYANWLSEIDFPRDRQSPRHSGELGLFERTPFPGGLAPGVIEKLYARSPVARFLLDDGDSNAFWREQAYQSQLKVVLAAQLFFRKNGRFPKGREEFLRGDLNQWPTDPFAPDDKPMAYRRDPETGNAIVWSVGYNGVDDNGQNVEGDMDAEDYDLGFVILAPGSKGEQ